MLIKLLVARVYKNKQFEYNNNNNDYEYFFKWLNWKCSVLKARPKLLANFVSWLKYLRSPKPTIPPIKSVICGLHLHEIS